MTAEAVPFASTQAFQFLGNALHIGFGEAPFTDQRRIGVAPCREVTLV
jgi:hypothetical protein